MPSPGLWQFCVGTVLQEELESVQKRAARFVTGNYNYETGSMTGILGQLKWESLKKRRKDNRIILLYKGLLKKVKQVYQLMTLSPKLGIVEMSTLWHFRLPLPIQTFILFIKIASSPQTIRDWNALPDSPRLISSAERIVLPSSLLW